MATESCGGNGKVSAGERVILAVMIHNLTENCMCCKPVHGDAYLS